MVNVIPHAVEALVGPKLHTTQLFVPFSGLPSDMCQFGWPPLVQLVAHQFSRLLGGNWK